MILFLFPKGPWHFFSLLVCNVNYKMLLLAHPQSRGVPRARTRRDPSRLQTGLNLRTKQQQLRPQGRWEMSPKRNTNHTECSFFHSYLSGGKRHFYFPYLKRVLDFFLQRQQQNQTGSEMQPLIQRLRTEEKGSPGQTNQIHSPSASINSKEHRNNPTASVSSKEKYLHRPN